MRSLRVAERLGRRLARVNGQLYNTFLRLEDVNDDYWVVSAMFLSPHQCSLRGRMRAMKMTRETLRVVK
jgi:hypothetical protein